MEVNYLCPKCKSYINIGNKVVLSAHVKDNAKGLLLFEKELGNYEVKKNDLIDYEEGDKVGFFCPICHANLTSEESPNLAKIIMVDNENIESDILFSQIAGEKATYKIYNLDIEAFGDNKENYFELLKENLKNKK